MGESRVIVLSGATKGLGRALVEGFLAQGHRVAGCGRSVDAVAELNDRHGPEGDFTALDVRDAVAVEAWAAAVIADWGAPSLLVNSAALINASAPLWEVPSDEFDALMEINLGGVHKLIRVFLPAMIASGRGVVANISSGWGRSVSPDVAPYCASKWGIEGLSQALAQELPAGLASVAVNPGIIDTDMLRSCFGAGAGAHEKPADWARAAVPFFLGLGPDQNGASLTVS